jgi:nicotinamide mononucleotide transporter
MSNIEIVATVLGLTNVLLIIQKSVWNYPFGLAMVVLFGFIFFEAKLYSDMLLQVFFFVIQIYGWWYWMRGLTSAGDKITPERLSKKQLVAAILSMLGLSSGLGILMAHLTDAALPFWDATVAGGSVVAQVLLSRRKIENWLYWIVVDVLSIGLFAVKGLYLTAGLYVVFLALAIWGFLSWMRTRETEVYAV